MHDVAQEVGLLGFAKVAYSHVRQRLLLQYLLGVLESFLLGDAGLSASATDEIQSALLVLKEKSLVE